MAKHTTNTDKRDSLISLLPANIADSDRLSISAKKMLGLLYSYRYTTRATETGVVIIGNDQITKLANISKTYVQLNTLALERYGLIVRLSGKKRVQGEENTASRYFLLEENWERPLQQISSEEIEQNRASAQDRTVIGDSERSYCKIKKSNIIENKVNEDNVKENKVKENNVKEGKVIEDNVNDQSLNGTNLEGSNDQDIDNNKNFSNKKLFNKNNSNVEELSTITDSDVEVVEDTVSQEVSTVSVSDDHEISNSLNNIDNDVVNDVKPQAAVSLSETHRNIDSDTPQATVTMEKSDYSWQTIKAANLIREAGTNAKEIHRQLQRVKDICKATVSTDVAIASMYYAVQRTANCINRLGLNFETDATDKTTLQQGLSILDKAKATVDPEEIRKLRNQYIKVSLKSGDPFTTLALLTKFNSKSVLGELKTEEQLTHYISDLPDNVLLIRPII